MNSNWSYNPEMHNLGQISDFLSCVTFKFDGRHRKSIGQLLYTTLSFAYHFKATGEFKLELQPGNAQFGSKSAIFFIPCDLEIWWMTLKNNRAPLLSNIKRCASLHHMWIQTGVMVGKQLHGFWPPWPWPLTLIFCMDITSVISNNSWKFCDDAMMGT